MRQARSWSLRSLGSSSCTVVFHALFGELHEHLFQRGIVRCKLVQRNTGTEGEVADRRLAHSRDADRPVRIASNPGALLLKNLREGVDSWGANPDIALLVAFEKFAHRCLSNKPSSANHDDIVGHL